MIPFKQEANLEKQLANHFLHKAQNKFSREQILIYSKLLTVPHA